MIDVEKVRNAGKITKKRKLVNIILPSVAGVLLLSSAALTAVAIINKKNADKAKEEAEKIKTKPISISTDEITSKYNITDAQGNNLTTWKQGEKKSFIVKGKQTINSTPAQISINGSLFKLVPAENNSFKTETDITNNWLNDIKIIIIEAPEAEKINLTFNALNGTVEGKPTKVIKVDAGLTWAAIQKPSNAIPADQNYEFNFWSINGQDPIADNTPITASMSIYAVYKETSSKWCTITFNKTLHDGTELPDLIWSGNNTVHIPRGTSWLKFDKPSAGYEGYQFQGWEYNAGTESTPDWQVIDPETFIVPNLATLNVYPKFSTLVTSITLITPTTELNLGEVINGYSVKLEGPGLGEITLSSSSEAIEIINVVPAPAPEQKVNFALRAKALVDVANKVTITAKWVDGITKQEIINTFQVNVPEPGSAETKSTDTYTIIDDNYYKLDMTTACNETTPIKVTNLLTSETTEVPRTGEDGFNYPILFGKYVTSIPANFLKDCTSFNNTITFKGNNLIYISYNFLDSCSTFNQKLTIPSNVQVIGDSFLANCTSFNNGATLGADPAETNNFVIPASVTQINGNFLFNCSNFNQRVVFEDDSKLSWIGEAFMQQCHKFGLKSSSTSLALTIPKSVQVIGEDFLTEVSSGNSIYIKFEAEAGKEPALIQCDGTFAAFSDANKFYVHITCSDSFKNDLKELFPNSTPAAPEDPQIWRTIV